MVCDRLGYRSRQTNNPTLQGKGSNKKADGATGEGEHLGAESKSGSRASGLSSGARGCR